MGPHYSSTDQGKCFIAELTQRVMAAFETNHKTTTAYHPQSNGQVERINHNLADMLSMFVSADHSDWDELLPFITFAYNTSRQETTGRTPFYLLHGREAVLPIDASLGIRMDPQTDGHVDYATQMLSNLQRAREEVKLRCSAFQAREKAYFNAKQTKGIQYAPGDRVLVFKPTCVVVRAEKLLHQWHGPFEILMQSSPVNYLVNVSKTARPKTEVVHVERLKKFHEPPAEVLPPHEGATTVQQP